MSAIVLADPNAEKAVVDRLIVVREKCIAVGAYRLADILRKDREAREQARRLRPRKRRTA